MTIARHAKSSSPSKPQHLPPVKISCQDVLQYFEMKFDAFIDYPPARQCFFTFLESTQNTEITLFLEQIEIFKSLHSSSSSHNYHPSNSTSTADSSNTSSTTSTSSKKSSIDYYFDHETVEDIFEHHLHGAPTLSQAALLKACEIADTFIQDHAPNELNLKSDTKKKILEKIEKNRIFYGLDKEQLVVREENDDVKGKHVSAVPFLDSTIFDDLEAHILLSLKSNQFANFLASDIFKDFVENESVETLFILGTPRSGHQGISTGGVDFLQLLNSKHSRKTFSTRISLNSHNIFTLNEALTLREVQYLRNTLLQYDHTSPNWTLLSYSKEQEIYATVMDGDSFCEKLFGRKDMMFYKSVTHYQYGSDRVYKALIDVEFRKFHTTEPVSASEISKYIQSGGKSQLLTASLNQQLDTVILTELYEMKWPIRNREFMTSCAGVQVTHSTSVNSGTFQSNNDNDNRTTVSSSLSNLDTFYLFKKSCNNNQYDLQLLGSEHSLFNSSTANASSHSKFKNTVQGYCLSALKVEPTSSTSCKTTHVMFVDMKGLLTQNWAQKILTHKSKSGKKHVTLLKTPQQQMTQWIEKDSLMALHSPVTDAILKTLSENVNIF
ncbi:hypothetical protein C9374_011133 [Naegleria lovaniensis]|uniref:RGS domain-containing protein n=1 Tax=Naegleria lovaniensis TaxID=51637 RepID=A0AA88GG96_NAELO|nr:uncharacterized protein C9374_011133 [Naegleria lovaniensis]KAG2374054.1 hypothetical protein C9374_011133 [Naegleria lovaniensis]